MQIKSALFGLTALFFAFAVNAQMAWRPFSVAIPFEMQSQRGATNTTLFFPAVGLRFAALPWSVKEWRFGLDSGVAFRLPIKDGTDLVYVQPFLGTIDAKAVVGYSVRSLAFTFVPKLYLGVGTQLGSIVQSISSDQINLFWWTPQVTSGIATEMRFEVIALKLEGGFGLDRNGLLFQSQVSIAYTF